jgi:hypothetical protein
MLTQTIQVEFPNELFHHVNSSRPLEHIDLSDWTPLITEQNVAQIAHKLSPACIKLELAGLNRLSKISDLQILFENCPRLKSLNLSQVESIPVSHPFHSIRLSTN